MLVHVGDVWRRSEDCKKAQEAGRCFWDRDLQSNEKDANGRDIVAKCIDMPDWVMDKCFCDNGAIPTHDEQNFLQLFTRRL